MGGRKKIPNISSFAKTFHFLVGHQLANLFELEPQLIKLEFIIYLPKLKVQQMGIENCGNRAMVLDLRDKMGLVECVGRRIRAKIDQNHAPMVKSDA